FGEPPRSPESLLRQQDMDLARSIQEVTEEVMVRLARTMKRETGAESLCLAGGVALNCVGNGKILRDGPFKSLWIQPAARDSGGGGGWRGARGGGRGRRGPGWGGGPASSDLMEVTACRAPS